MTRTNRRTLAGPAAALAILALAACRASSGGDAKLSVHLVDGPEVAFTELNLDVQAVEISRDGSGWITLSEPDVVVNLLSLTGGVAETLVDGASIPAGSYGQLRLVLGRRNTVRTLDGELHDLRVPSGMQSGVKLNAHFTVAPNTTKDVFVDFDAHRSIFVHETGASAQYVLRPVVRAFDRVVTGAVVGALSDGAGAPLPGVRVMAETLDALGVPSVARAAVTAADGSYVLDLLPVGGAYWVVAQPRVGGLAYAAGAAGPFAIAEAAPVVAADLAFAPAPAAGGIAGTVAPAAAAGAFDEVVALGTVSVAGVDRTFVLRTAPATISAGVERYALDLLPAATYDLFVTRGTDDGSGGLSWSAGPAETATVLPGITTALDLSAP